jgi:hypothetical protein
VVIGVVFALSDIVEHFAKRRASETTTTLHRSDDSASPEQYHDMYRGRVGGLARAANV